MNLPVLISGSFTSMALPWNTLIIYNALALLLFYAIAVSKIVVWINYSKKSSYDQAVKPSRRFPYLYLDRQPCNRSLYNCVVGALSGRLGMSKEAVKQRLIEMGLLIVEDNACGYWDNAGAILKRRELNSLICWI